MGWVLYMWVWYIGLLNEKIGECVERREVKMFEGERWKWI